MFRQISNTNYYINELGIIENRKFKNTRKLRPYKSGNGYMCVRLCVNGKVTNYTLHRLLAQAFIANSKNLRCVNHKDGNKLNNALDNLEWASYSYNSIHAYNMALTSVPTRPKTKVVLENSNNNNNNHVICHSITEASNRSGISKKSILRYLDPHKHIRGYKFHSIAAFKNR